MQGKMLYLRQKKKKKQEPPNYCQDTQVYKPNKNNWFVLTVLLAHFNSMGQTFAVDLA